MKGGTVAVLDVGKSDVKLSASTNEGHVLETLTLPNRVLPGPPWQHHDLAAWRVALNWGHPQFVCHGLTEFHRLKGSGRGIEEALGSNRQRGGW